LPDLVFVCVDDDGDHDREVRWPAIGDAVCPLLVGTCFFAFAHRRVAVRPLRLPHRFLFDEVYGIEGPIASVLL
jgi:hypothetical protein